MQESNQGSGKWLGLLEKTMDALPMNIAILDQEGTIVQVNKSWRDFADDNGLKTDNYCIGQNYIGICESAEGDFSGIARIVADSLKEIINSERSGFSMEYPCHGPSEKRWFILNAQRLDTAEPKVLVVHYNITPRKMAEKEMQLANTKLKLMGSTTRHDILNQLSVMLGYLNLLAKDVKSKKGERYIDKIESGGRKIQRLLDFSRDFEKLGIEKRWMDLEEIVESTFSHFELGNISVEIDLDGMEVFGDPLLEKVFYNLIDNTLAHGGREITLVRVSYSTTDDGIRVVFGDDGPGIPVDLKESIFQQGFGTGTGYGLYLIKQILIGSDMDIQEVGTEGEGATFEIFVPEHLVRVEA